MEIIGTKGASIAGEVKATAFVFTGGNTQGAQTWQQGYNFGVGAGFALALHEGHTGTLMVKGQHASGKGSEFFQFAVIDDAVMIHSTNQFGGSFVSVTAEGSNINIQANFNNVHIAYMLTYF